MGEAADLLSISPDTVRRLINRGQLRATLTERGRHTVSGADLAAYMRDRGRKDERLGASSARNRLPGIVTNIKKTKVMAQLEIQAGPHRIVALLSREALDHLGLTVGDKAAAVIKATAVIIEAS
jgi:molybdopterin-binding protein